MRVPSLKALRQAFPEKANEIHRILKANRSDLLNNPAAAKRAFESYNPPATYILRMEAINDVGFYGCEAVQSTNGEYAEYLNTGDLYALTIIRWRGNYRIQSVGDFVETMERRGIRFY